MPNRDSYHDLPPRRGEHVIEFESEDIHDFNMVALQMPGGHAHHHHDHGHGAGPFEWAGIFSMSDSTTHGRCRKLTEHTPTLLCA